MFKPYELPAVFGEYFVDKARRLKKLNESMSSKQKNIIAKSYEKDFERAIKSVSVKAMEHDVKMFGKKSFEEEG